MEITLLLRRVQTGGQKAQRELIPIVYEGLNRLARAHLRELAAMSTLAS